MKISLQSIYNKAWAAFIVSDARPGFDFVKACCVYKTTDGRACAIGLEIPDGHPAQKSTQNFQGLVCDFPDLFDEEINQIAQEYNESDLMSRGRSKLFVFQTSLHDYLIDLNTGEWKFTKEERRQKYIEVAKAFNLTIPEESNGTCA